MKGVRGVKNQGVSEGSLSTDRDDYDFDWATQEFESCHSDQKSSFVRMGIQTEDKVLEKGLCFFCKNEESMI